MIATLIASLNSSRFTSVSYKVRKLWLAAVPLHPNKALDLVNRVLL